MGVIFAADRTYAVTPALDTPTRIFYPDFVAYFANHAIVRGIGSHSEPQDGYHTGRCFADRSLTHDVAR